MSITIVGIRDILLQMDTLLTFPWRVCTWVLSTFEALLCSFPGWAQQPWDMGHWPRKCIPWGIYQRKGIHHSWTCEFEELKGHVLVICKALYGLHTSGLCWHECSTHCLWAIGFTSSKAEHHNHDKYEDIAIYVDDLAIAAKDPKQIVETLMEKYKFKLKRTGPISFHLEMDFFQDKCGILCMVPMQYIEKMCGNFEHIFGHPLKLWLPLQWKIPPRAGHFRPPSQWEDCQVSVPHWCSLVGWSWLGHLM